MEGPEVEMALYEEAKAKQWKKTHGRSSGGVCDGGSDRDDQVLGAPRADPQVKVCLLRDKNVAKRRECIACDMDPDIGSGQLLTEAPTATKVALTCLLAWCSVKSSTGSSQRATFPQWQRYMEQPVRGLIRVRKGIFGLCNSPRLW